MRCGMRKYKYIYIININTIVSRVKKVQKGKTRGITGSDPSKALTPHPKLTISDYFFLLNVLKLQLGIHI